MIDYEKGGGGTDGAVGGGCEGQEVASRVGGTAAKRKGEEEKETVLRGNGHLA